MKKASAVAVLFACSIASGRAGAGEAVKFHPMLRPYPGSELRGSDCVVHDFDEFELPLGPIARDAKTNTNKPSKSQHLEGRWTWCPYHNPEGRSSLEIIKNYEQALTAAGFTILYSCKNADCGKQSDNIDVHPWFAPDDSARRYLAAKLERPEGDVYATVNINAQNETMQGNAEINVIEVKPMQGKMVTVDASALDQGLKRTGHVAVYGIYFDTDKAVVKAESRPVLAEIAKLLAKEPELKLYVVGHTDNQGALDHNMTLSQARAKNVVGVLVRKNGVAAERLQGAGVGPLAPVASNETEEGRAKNRRVELVQQ